MRWTLGARFFAGVFAGLLWALVAGYAGRMAPDHLRGRAITLAMVGTRSRCRWACRPETFMGAMIGWRYAFGVMSILTVILVGWVVWKVPDFPGQTADKRLPIARVMALPGVRAVLAVTLVFVLAHNILYTYIAPFLTPAGMAGRTDAVLFVFGLAALGGIWVSGMLIDRWLRELVLLSTAGFAIAALALGVWGAVPAVIYASMVLWGFAYGGVPALFQTASANAAGEAADVAQSMIVTVWNVGIAGGGLIGGGLLATLGVGAFPWTLLALLVVTFLIAVKATRGFPKA